MTSKLLYNQEVIYTSKLVEFYRENFKDCIKIPDRMTLQDVVAAKLSGSLVVVWVETVQAWQDLRGEIPLNPLPVQSWLL
jgi:hypothetical protein